MSQFFVKMYFGGILGAHLLSPGLHLCTVIPSVRGNAALMLSRALRSSSRSPCALSNLTTSTCELYEYGFSSSCNSHTSFTSNSKQMPLQVISFKQTLFDELLTVDFRLSQETCYDVM